MSDVIVIFIVVIHGWSVHAPDRLCAHRVCAPHTHVLASSTGGCAVNVYALTAVKLQLVTFALAAARMDGRRRMRAYASSAYEHLLFAMKSSRAVFFVGLFWTAICCVVPPFCEPCVYHTRPLSHKPLTHCSQRFQCALLLLLLAAIWL